MGAVDGGKGSCHTRLQEIPDTDSTETSLLSPAVVSDIAFGPTGGLLAQGTREQQLFCALS
jgi:hypothetical protein